MEKTKYSRTRMAFEWGCRLILAAAFIYAGVLKNGNPQAFAGSIATFEILPEGWVNVVALTLPWLEILSGLLLLIGPWTRVGALSLVCLNGIFLLALLSAIIRGIPVDCGCFGSSGPSSPAKVWLAIGRDVVFLAMAVFVYLRARAPSRSR